MMSAALGGDSCLQMDAAGCPYVCPLPFMRQAAIKPAFPPVLLVRAAAPPAWAWRWRGLLSSSLAHRVAAVRVEPAPAGEHQHCTGGFSRFRSIRHRGVSVPGRGGSL